MSTTTSAGEPQALIRSAAPEGRVAPQLPVPTGRSGRRLVIAGVSLLLVLCVVGSVTAAFGRRAAARTQDRSAFEVASADIVASMSSALRRDTDFVATLRSTLVTRPGMKNAELAQWLSVAEATERYPGGTGFAYIARVPYSGLAAFEAQMLADPPPNANSARPAQLAPGGVRKHYCIIKLVGGVPVGASTIRLPLLLDICASIIPGILTQQPVVALNAAMKSGQFITQPIDLMHGVFAIAAPLYRRGIVPKTLAQRQAALLGWAAGTFDGAAILGGGGGVRDGMRVQISHQNPGAEPVVLAEAGRAVASGPVRSVPVSADGSWTVRVSGSAAKGGISAEAQFWIVLAVGLALSGLVFGFVLVLARGRDRALRLVARKTAELRYQATHDGLTGLANRTLILDRMEQALVRSRRLGTPIAVLFLDLDGFKDINDRFGHATGDELLRAVSGRLTGVLRENDTVGRLGGDEFVLLVEGQSLQDGPGAVAERIREVLAVSFLLGGAHEGVFVHASIGIAEGPRNTADELLRDADLALYEAKNAGKDRHVVFDLEMRAAVQHSVEAGDRSAR